MRFRPRSVETAPFWRYHRDMPSIQIKNVPDEVHEALQRKAKTSGQSLQEFLQAELRKIADRATMAEIFERTRADGVHITFEDAIQAVHAERRGD